MTTTSDTIEPDQDTAEPSTTDDAEKLVPVTEAIRYRKRAQAAEQQLNEPREQLTELQSHLDSPKQSTAPGSWI